MKKVLRWCLSIVVGGIVGVVAYFLIAVLITKVGNLIFSALHWLDPETASWAPFVTPSLVSLAAGVLSAQKVSGDHRPYCVAVIVVNLLPILLDLWLGELGLSLLLRRGLYIVPAWMFFMSPPDEDV